MPPKPDPRKSICYIVSHGFAARMIMQTDLLGGLTRSGVKVSIISPDSNDSVLMEYCNQFDIDLYSFHSKKWIWRSNYMLYRSYFLEDIKANPALYEKHYHEIYLVKHKWKILKLISYVLICMYYIVKRFPILRIAYKKLENLFLKSSKAINLLKTIQPDLLVSTYPVSPQEGILLHNAKKINIRTVIHLLSWDNITSKGHFLSMASYYLAWGPIMKEEFIEKYNIPPELIYITGVPHFDLHIQSRQQTDSNKILQEFGLDDKKPYIVFGMSSPRFVPKEIEIVEYLAHKINENEFGLDMQMIIRPHPQNVRGWMADLHWIDRLNMLKNDRIKIFYPILASSKLPWSMEHEDMKKLSAILASCIVCINSCSTLSMDTLMAGKGNIAPMFDGDVVLPYWNSAKRLLDYTHINKFIKTHGTVVVDNYQSLLDEIKKFHQKPDYKIIESIEAIKRECGNSNGSSTHNVIQSLLHILEHP